MVMQAGILVQLKIRNGRIRNDLFSQVTIERPIRENSCPFVEEKNEQSESIINGDESGNLSSIKN
jgi:hypothetical protein